MIPEELEIFEQSLPAAPAPAGDYVPAVLTGNLLFLSGTLCMKDGAIVYAGKVGRDLTIEDAQAGARLCAINTLANAKAALGTLDRVTRVVNVAGFVNAEPGFSQSPQVINGASALFGEVFGEAGKHTRAAVGVTGLPLNSAVEITAVLEVD